MFDGFVPIDGGDGGGRGLPWRNAGVGLGLSFNPPPAQPAAPAGPPPNPAGNILPTSDQLGQFAPLPYTDFGQIPYIDPTYMNSGQVDLTQMPGAMSAFQQELATSLAPTFFGQQQSQDADLASRGIFNSGAAQQAQNDLYGQQAAAMAAPLGQLTQQFANYWNQGQQANALYNQQANQFNAGVANDISGLNANAYSDVTNQYANQFNAFLANLFSQGSSLSTGLLGSFLGSFQPNNAATGILDTGASNAGAAYQNAYNNGMQQGGIFGNALSNALGSLLNRPSPTGPAAQPQSPGPLLGPQSVM